MNSITSINSYSVDTTENDTESPQYLSFPEICWTANTDALISFSNGQYKNYGKKLAIPNTVTFANPDNIFSFDANNVKFGNGSLKHTMSTNILNYLRIDNFVMKTTTGFSACCWFRYTNLHATGGLIFGSNLFTYSGRTSSVQIIFTNATTIRVNLGFKYVSNNWTSCYQDFNISTYGISNNGNWNHIGYSISTTGVVTLVVNGTSITWNSGNVIYLYPTGSPAYVYLADNSRAYFFYVGSSNASGNSCFEGNTDQLRLYNATLTVQNFQDIYNNGC